MNPYFVIIDKESEYYGQIVTLIVRSTVGTGLAVYTVKTASLDTLTMLSYQITGGFLLRSYAENYAKKLM